MFTLSLIFESINCLDCEVIIRDIVGKFFVLQGPDSASTIEKTSIESKNASTADVMEANVEILDNVVVVSMANCNKQPPLSLIEKLTSSLRKEGYFASEWTLTENGLIVLSSKSGTEPLNDVFSLPDLWRQYRSKILKKHMFTKNCRAWKAKDEFPSCENSDQPFLLESETEYRAVVSVQGMTCASCSQSVSDVITSVISDFPSSERDVSFSVDLLQQTAVIVVKYKQQVNKIIDAIKDAGFTSSLIEILPINRSISLEVTALIGGITCAACVNSVTSAVTQLPFVLECGIDAITKSGLFILSSDTGFEESNVEKLKQTVEDCGFDFNLSSKKQINFSSSKQASRKINISVEGMFCSECPKAILNYLNKFGGAVVVEDPLTVDQPFLEFSYVPNQERGLTVRNILKDLNHIRTDSDWTMAYVIDYDTQGFFKCQLVEKPTVEDQVKILRKKETFKILWRLLITAVFAIPTFIFGIVGMSLLPSDDEFRIWLDTPIWAGNVSRITWILLILSTPVYIFATGMFHDKALREFQSLWKVKTSWRTRFFKFGSMNLLVSLGTSVAYYSSIALLIVASRQPVSHMAMDTTYFDTVVFLTFFLLIGRYLEIITKSKAADAVTSLSALKPTLTTIVQKMSSDVAPDSDAYIGDETVNINLLDTGDFIKISPGESPPVDCVVVKGSTKFDESALTGESYPVTREKGQQLFTGTINVGSDAIIARVLDIQGKSLLDQMVSTVRDGQMRKAPIQRLADTLTGYFVPIVVALAILTWIIWLSLAYTDRLPESYLDIDFGGWIVWSLEFSIAVFVIACPCGIGLAAPTALLVGSGMAAKYGILAQGGGAAFQDAAQVGVICFDKTGTLTEGKMKVTDIASITIDVLGTDKTRTLAYQISRDLELASKHPVASAIKNFTESPENVGDLIPNIIPLVETIDGKGIRGKIQTNDNNSEVWKMLNNEEAIIGNEKLFLDYGVQLDPNQRYLIESWKKESKSIVLVAISSQEFFNDSRLHLIAAFACRDQVRQESIPVLQFLRKKGIECWMITGDNPDTAYVIGELLGFDKQQIISNVMPDTKRHYVEDLKARTGKIVAMVGDGINDAPALSVADIGVALSSGADLAMTASDFIILSKAYPLLTLCTLFDLSRVVLRRVKFNFCWSLIYNIIGIPIAAGVIYPYHNLRLSPVWASLAMAASSVSVIVSSLLLKLYKPKVQVRNLETNVTEDIIQTNYHRL